MCLNVSHPPRGQGADLGVGAKRPPRGGTLSAIACNRLSRRWVRALTGSRVIRLILPRVIAIDLKLSNYFWKLRLVGSTEKNQTVDRPSSYKLRMPLQYHRGQAPRRSRAMLRGCQQFCDKRFVQSNSTVQFPAVLMLNILS